MLSLISLAGTKASDVAALIRKRSDDSVARVPPTTLIPPQSPHLCTHVYKPGTGIRPSAPHAPNLRRMANRTGIKTRRAPDRCLAGVQHEEEEGGGPLLSHEEILPMGNFSNFLVGPDRRTFLHPTVIMQTEWG